jgi:ketosteroid isomerase-like protein
MSPENLDSVRAVYDGWAKGDFLAGAELLSPEIVFVLRPEFPDAGIYHGPEGVRGYMRLFLTSWTDLTITPEEFIEAEGSVVVGVHQRGTGRESGIPADLRYFQVWTFRGAKVIRLEGVRDRAEALEAVGLQGVTRPS